ncbi:hypothetical protein ACTQ1O_04685 [Bilifractor sp. LCP21S3_A7]|uniref:hypothetical protein n=1 Tax=Bilifractor sp. LCP21S3_A7 TaxID=3438738 RepID=UPI003F933430
MDAASCRTIEQAADMAENPASRKMMRCGDRQSAAMGDDEMPRQEIIRPGRQVTRKRPGSTEMCTDVHIRKEKE